MKILYFCRHYLKDGVLLIIGLILLNIHFCWGQTDNCTPAKLLYAFSSNNFKDKAVVIDPNNSIGFWRTDRPINVCWENFKDYEKYNSERNAVRIATKSTWEENSTLSFSGWQKCKIDSEQGIHIAIKDTQPVTKCLGVALNAKKDGMTLNFNFTDKWGKGIKRQFISANNGNFDKIKLIQMLAIHEFGHAVGLAHLHIQPNRNLCNEFSDFQKKDNNNNIGVWFMGCNNSYSVMNYCLDDYINRGELSNYDKEVIGILYGFPNNKNIKKYKLECSVNNTGIAVQPNEKSVAELSTLNLKQELKINKYSKAELRGPIQESFPGLKANWSHIIIKLVGTGNNLKEVEYVKYYLFEKMIDDRYNIIAYPEDNFSRSFYSWGRYEIKAEIKLKNIEQPLFEYIIPNIPDFEYIKDGKKRTESRKGRLIRASL